MSKKLKVATTWLQGCSGCHIALLDLHEDLVDVLNFFDISYSPFLDFKTVPKVDIGIIEGTVANEENEKTLKLFREKAGLIVALGTCACFGGIAGLRNLFFIADVLKRCYGETESTIDGKMPDGKELPQLTEIVKPVNEIIKVDCYIPGCPPLASSIKETLTAIYSGREPEIKTRNLCEECDRKKTKMLRPSRDFLTETVYTVNELDTIDPDVCFLEQGVLCMGPATREGCGARCLKGNMPCRGCMGPTPDALEQGAKVINALSSILPAGALMFNEDIVGVGYRYSLPISIYPHLSGEGRKDG